LANEITLEDLVRITKERYDCKLAELSKLRDLEIEVGAQISDAYDEKEDLHLDYQSAVRLLALTTQPA
jgi:hypothetical protein